MNFKFTKTGPNPLYKAGASHIIKLIAEGTLQPGAQLPSVRDFATENEINPNTAQRVYAELESGGYITTVQGQGSTVAFKAENQRDSLSPVAVFWSYAHKDDTNSRGAIRTLLDSVRNEYELATGNSLDVFVDDESIDWGTNWREAIEGAVQRTTFFIPVLTPTYLKRPACLNELKTAIDKFQTTGIQKGIYPIRFVNIQRALDTCADDDLVQFLSDTQGINFFSIGTRNPDSPEYQTMVQKIVADLVAIEDELYEERDSIEAAAIECGRAEEDAAYDEHGGYIDNLAAMEAETGRQTELLQALSEDMKSIGNLAKKSTAEMEQSNATGSGFATKLAIIKKMATELDPLSDSLKSKCIQFTSSMATMSKGMNAYLDIAEENPGSRSAEFEHAVREMSRNAGIAFDSCRSFSGTLDSVGKMSREFRKPFSEIQSGLALLCSNEEIFTLWEQKLDALGEVEQAN